MYIKMKKEFSTAWISSKQPRKQRKYLANAPIHLKQKLLSVNLSKDLQKKHKTRNVVVRKGDTVKVTRGKFAKKQGKVLEVKTKRGKIYVEGINRKKLDGSSVLVPFRASNLQIIELILNDKKRAKKLKTEVKQEKKETPKKEETKENSKEKIKEKQGEKK